jgi:hypothetical protein
MKRIRELFSEYFNATRVGWFLAFRQIRRAGKGTTALIIFIMVLTFLNLVVVSGLLIGLITGSYAQYRSSYTGEVLITAAQGKAYSCLSKSIIDVKNMGKIIKLEAGEAFNSRVPGFSHV